MGLSAPRKRTKLSHDPNNTKWTNDTGSFGLKIMTSQGWQPGQYLGAKDATHAEFHTAANASHIRVAIKDDNLGLGAKIGTGVGHGECTGLDAFKNILGRLNGKDEDELAAEQKSREDLKRAIYTERRWGSIRFVKGGFLIGDKIQLLIDGEAERLRKVAEEDQESSTSDSSSEEEEDPASATVVEPPKKPKRKRKLEDVEETVPEVVAVKVKKSKKKRKSDARREENEVAAALEEVKLSRKKSKNREPNVGEEDTAEDLEAKRRKREKRDRRDRKEKKETKGKSKPPAEQESAKKSKKKSKRDKLKSDFDETLGSSEPTSRIATKESTPLAVDSSGRSTPMMQGRHAVRSRNIAQKRLASMDVAALNQIFMIKS